MRNKFYVCLVGIFFANILSATSGTFMSFAKIGSWAIEGKCRVYCANPEGWRFFVETIDSGEKGVELVRVKLHSQKPSKLPVFSVMVNLSGDDARFLWRPELSCRKFDRAGVMPYESHARFMSSAVQWLPLYAFLDGEDKNILTVSSSESRGRVVFRGGTQEGPNTLVAEYTYNTKDCETLRESFEVTVRYDTRRRSADVTLADAAAWIRKADPAVERPVPEAAFEPLWSSWCAYHSSITDAIVEEEAAIARSIGLNTIIIDDGWQFKSGPWWIYNGENLPNERYSKDFVSHIKRIREAGTKVVLWYPVNLITDNVVNFADYKERILFRRSWGPYVWDPRFPDRREFFLSRIKTAMKEWKVDGLKLDFVDSWGLDFDGCKHPDVTKGLNGRDTPDLMEVASRVMLEARDIVSGIRPDGVIEFRQCYIGPAMLKACTQMRVQDCPGSLPEMRYGIANLRLLCGQNAVHSDPIQWSKTASEESVADSILASIFGIGQYSVRLREIPKGQLAVLKHYIAFAREHAQALYRGSFRVQGLTSDAPVLVGEIQDERIIGVYKSDFVASCGAGDKRIIVLNGTGTERVTLRFDSPVKFAVYGPRGQSLGTKSFAAGVFDVEIPRGGYISSLTH